MSDSTPNPVDYGKTSLLLLVSLKYALAGDLESNDAIEALEARLPLINWNDPAFVQFSEEMRAGVPRLTPEQEKALEAPLSMLLYAMRERNEVDYQTVAKLVPEVKKVMEAKAKLIDQLSDLYLRMYAELLLLGADVSKYQAPTLEP